MKKGLLGLWRTEILGERMKTLYATTFKWNRQSTLSPHFAYATKEKKEKGCCF
jgi:hypothetical protein